MYLKPTDLAANTPIVVSPAITKRHMQITSRVLLEHIALVTREEHAARPIGYLLHKAIQDLEMSPTYLTHRNKCKELDIMRKDRNIL